MKQNQTLSEVDKLLSKLSISDMLYSASYSDGPTYFEFPANKISPKLLPYVGHLRRYKKGISQM